MKRIHIIAMAFAALFAFSMVSASGASAFTLWDQCTKTASPLEFTESNCITKSTSGTWGWEEIKSLAAVDSLVTVLKLTSGPVTVECEGTLDGSVGPSNEDEVTELLTVAGVAITEAKPVTCKVAAASEGVCGKSATASPDGLPWLTLLVAAGDILEAHAGGENPGWLVKCVSGLENLCLKAETTLTVANLEAELEVDLTFPKIVAECTSILAKEGEVAGTVSILLVNENALRAM